MRELGRIAAATVALAAVIVAGCGGGDGDSDSGGPTTGFERALESIGEGVSPAGSGFGWIDMAGFRDLSPRERARLALALGPGADDLVRTPQETARALGTDPREATEAISISGSYTLGARLDGIPGATLADRMRAAGARERRQGEWRLFSLGGWSESRVRGPLAPLGAYVSRVATARDAVILTRFGPARHALLGEGTSPLADPSVALAASCLGSVETARTLPGTFTHNKATSPDLLAVGRAPAGTETICAIDDDGDASAHADALEASLDPGARDPVSGEPIGELVRGAEVTTVSGDGPAAARASLEPAPGTPGFVFGALVRGSLLTYTGSEPPISDEVARRLRQGESD